MKLEKLFELIKNRKQKLPKNSYTTSLFEQGLDRISQKVGEEAIETIIAAKNESQVKLICEMADLWYHCLVLLVEKNLNLKDLETELEKRRQKG